MRLPFKKIMVPLMLSLPISAYGAGTCPSTPTGTVVPITDFDPPAAQGTVPLEPDDMIEFIQQNNITSISQLLGYFPPHMNKNFSLVEHTQTPGTSSLYNPRVVMFGSDAKFMVNVSTDPNDPTYDLMDLAYLEEETGIWEFSQLDFSQAQPVLHKNPESCIECHGNPGKPVWGQYLNWPGVFGDDDSTANAPETLEPRHAQAFRFFKTGGGNQDRMHNLVWANNYQDNRAQMLADHAYGFALSVMNMEIARSVSEGMYLRLKNHQKWPQVRHELMYSMYCDQRKRRAGYSEKQKLSSLISSLGGSGNRRDNFFSALGIDIQHDFAIHRMTKDGLDGQDFNVNTDSLYGLLGALILDDLRKADTQIKNILQNGPNNYKIWSCPQLGSNTDEVLDFKMTHGWKLKGSARQQVQETFFDVDMFRIFQVVHDQVEAPMCNYLASVIDTSVTDDGDDNGGGDDNSGGDNNGGGDDNSGGDNNGGGDDNSGGDNNGGGDDNSGGDDNGGGDNVDISHIPDMCASNPAVTFVPQLQNNNLSSSCISGNQRVYGYFFVPAGISRITLETGHGNGASKIYHKDQGYPTESSFDNETAGEQNHQKMVIDNPRVRTYHHFLVPSGHSSTTIKLTLE